MSLWKVCGPEVRKLMCKTRLTGAVKLVRLYAKDVNAPKVQSIKKVEVEEICKDDHPVARTREEAIKDFPFYDLIKFKKECCVTDCIEKDFPSYDECFYKESDKNKRDYQITWAECPQVAIKPKKICCYENAVPPPKQRRLPQFKPETACKVQNECEVADYYCPKTTAPHCRPAREPPKCAIVRHPTYCFKIKAPYPSFSECVRAPLKGPKRKTECHCWEEIPYYILLQYIKKRERLGKKGFTPCDK